MGGRLLGILEFERFFRMKGWRGCGGEIVVHGEETRYYCSLTWALFGRDGEWRLLGLSL